MDLTILARDALTSGGPNAPALALAALQGDKDEVIRLLLAERRAEVLDRAALAARDAVLGTVTKNYHALREALATALTVGPMTNDEVLIGDLREYSRALNASHRTRAAAEDRATALELENKKLCDAVAAEQARILELNGEVMSIKADCEQLREDFRATDNGWEELGQGISQIVGVKWDELPNCNDDLLQKVRGLQAELHESRERDLWARGKLEEAQQELSATQAVLKATEAREYAIRLERDRLQREEQLRLEGIRANARAAARASAVTTPSLT